jgi:hypothetical protein
LSTSSPGNHDIGEQAPSGEFVKQADVAPSQGSYNDVAIEEAVELLSIRPHGHGWLFSPKRRARGARSQLTRIVSAIMDNRPREGVHRLMLQLGALIPPSPTDR